MPQTQSQSDLEPLPTSPEDLLKCLNELGISYELHHHEPIFTVAEGEHLKKNIPGVHCRNLYLRDKKKNNFLVVAANETEIDLKSLAEKIGEGRFSFGSADRLWEHLGIRPGSVCPFTVINDREHKVRVILDAHMMQAEIVNYHPLDNAMTVGISPADLLKFFEFTGHTLTILDL